MNTPQSIAPQYVADKKAPKAGVERQNLTIGLVRDLNATAEQSRALILAEGVRPKDSLFSCGIISARNEK